MRPHFEITLPDDGRSILDAINEELTRPDSPFIGKVLATHAYRGAAFVGQGLVQEEMYAMRAWVERLARLLRAGDS